MLNDTLANALSVIMNSETKGKSTCTITPSSDVIKKTLKIMQENNYIGSFEEEKDSRGSCLKLNLLGAINKCGVIKPRFPVRKDESEAFEKRFLPAKEFGMLIMSTPKGIMTLAEAKKKGIGGKLVAYCY